MKKDNGVYYVPCKINGLEMQFIFDTGASDITMSAVEAMYLYKQGKLTDDDILGTQQYQIADGSIAEGTVVNLRTVTIGNRTLNDVQASIVHNLDAPLLLGQSALAEFGKISIDYNKREITFE
jgi:aspartyl protease family protein